eukprot:3742065-Pleurochrysis_carterae.AAC.1
MNNATPTCTHLGRLSTRDGDDALEHAWQLAGTGGATRSYLYMRTRKKRKKKFISFALIEEVKVKTESSATSKKGRIKKEERKTRRPPGI